MPEPSPQPLLDALAKITGTGVFCTSGERAFVFPQLTLAGGEELAFPLPPAQLAAIDAAAEAAPYGKGEATVRDESVRRCRQVDATDFTVGNPAWDEMVAEIAAAAADEMGVAGKVRATPYKLLLYGKGGHFKPHRDTEKLGAMFGTLIVALPSKHSGGELRVRHAGGEERVDFSGAQGLRKVQFAAFFADCEHEVRPVTGGHRLCLVYNLSRPKARKEPVNVLTGEHSKTLRHPLRKLADGSPGDLDVVLLDHRYTEKSFSLAGLKGADRGRAGALFDAATAEGLVAHLALVSLYQIGQLEQEWNPYGGDDEDEDEGEMGDLIEESLTLSHWRDAGDNARRLGDHDIDRARLVAGAEVDGGDPDEQFAEGYTGNAGCTMERWYRRAGVVLWRPEDAEGIAARYRFNETVDKWRRQADAKRAGNSAAFVSLGMALIERAEAQVERYTSGGLRVNGGTFFAIARTVGEAGQPELIARASEKLLPALVPHADTATLAALVRALGAERVVDLATATKTEDDTTCGGRQPWVQREQKSQAANTRFRLLSALLKNLNTNDDVVRSLAADIAADLSLPTDRGGVPPAERVHIALAASHLLTTKRALSTLRKGVLAAGDAERVRDVLAPALLQKTHRRLLVKSGSLAGEVFAHCLAVLKAEATRSIDAFPDWRRHCPTDGKPDEGGRFWRPAGAEGGKSIAALRLFLADPATETSRFPLRQQLRDVLTGYIDRHRLDLEYRVEKKGSPYSLVCTKTSASLARDRRQQKDDSKLLAKLEQSELVN